MEDSLYTYEQLSPTSDIWHSNLRIGLSVKTLPYKVWSMMIK